MRLLFALPRQDVVCIDMLAEVSRQYFDASPPSGRGFYGRDATRSLVDAARKKTSRPAASSNQVQPQAVGDTHRSGQHLVADSKGS